MIVTTSKRLKHILDAIGEKYFERVFGCAYIELINILKNNKKDSQIKYIEQMISLWYS